MNFFSYTRVEVCSLLLAHGADPTLLNCHSKAAVDAAPTRELQDKLSCMIFILYFETKKGFTEVQCSCLCIVMISTVISLIFPSFFVSTVEFKGHQLLEAAKACDSTKLKKQITPEIINFQHPLTLESSLVCTCSASVDKRGCWLLYHILLHNLC